MNVSITIPILSGWLLGWLVNYLADVLPLTRRLSAPQCLHCGEQLPISTYLAFQRCPSCGKSRSRRGMAVQVVLMTLLAWAWLTTPKLGFWPSALLLAYFTLVTVMDLEHRVVMHPVSIAGAALGLVIGTWAHGLLRTLIGGAAGFGIMLVFYYGGIWFARYLARRRGQSISETGIGFGDVNLSGVLGLMLGWPGILAGLTLGILLAGAFSIILLIIVLLARRYEHFLTFPYAPFLVLGTAILLI